MSSRENNIWGNHFSAVRSFSASIISTCNQNSILEDFHLLAPRSLVPLCPWWGWAPPHFPGTAEGWCSSEELSHQLETVNYPLLNYNIYTAHTLPHNMIRTLCRNRNVMISVYQTSLDTVHTNCIVNYCYIHHSATALLIIIWFEHYVRICSLGRGYTNPSLHHCRI
jgi:hypothetical protein